MYLGVKVSGLGFRGCGSLLAYGWGLVPRVSGLGVGVKGLGFRVQDLGFRVQGLWLRV